MKDTLKSIFAACHSKLNVPVLSIVHLFCTSLEFFLQEFKLLDEREYLYFAVWWKGPGSVSDFLCSGPEAAI